MQLSSLDWPLTASNDRLGKAMLVKKAFSSVAEPVKKAHSTRCLSMSITKPLEMLKIKERIVRMGMGPRRIKKSLKIHCLASSMQLSEVMISSNSRKVF